MISYFLLALVLLIIRADLLGVHPVGPSCQNKALMMYKVDFLDWVR